MPTEVECGQWRHECNRCGYVWYTKTKNPKNCAATTCKSPYWNKERKYDTPPERTSKPWGVPRKKGKRGRPKANADRNA